MPGDEVLRFGLSRKAQSFQTIPIGIKRALGLIVVMHRTLCLDRSFAVALASLFGSEGCSLG